MCEKLVSIIVPCYNVEEYIAQCLDSLINQSMDPELYEIILLDDCSTDRTGEIIAEYEKKFSEQIIFVTVKNNVGSGYLRNLGMEYASGKYIMFVDADDFITSDMLFYMSEAMIESNADMGECGFYMFDDCSAQICMKSKEMFDLEVEDERRRYLLQYGSLNSPWAKIWKRSFLMNNNIYFAEGYTREDIIFYQLSIAHVHYVIHVDKALYYYRLNDKGVSRGPEAVKKAFDAAYVQELSYQELICRGRLLAAYLEWEYLFFRKAFLLPYTEILEAGQEEAYKDMITEVAEMVIDHWPDVFDNPYIVQLDLKDARKYFIDNSKN